MIQDDHLKPHLPQTPLAQSFLLAAPIKRKYSSHMPLPEKALKEALFALLIEKHDLCVKHTFQISAYILELIVNWNYTKT